MSTNRTPFTVHHIINGIVLENGGAEKIARILHGDLCERGRASRLISLVDEDLEPIKGYSSLYLSSPYTFSAIQKIRRYIVANCGAADVIHAHLFPTMLYVSLAARLARWRGRVVCTEHSTSNRRRGTLRGQLIDRVLYSRYDRVFCISEGTKTALEDWQPRLKDRLQVIENGAELPFETFTERPFPAKPVVVSVGRLYKPKNYQTALRAIALLKDIDFEYRIAGSGPDEEKLRGICRELNIEDRVRFLGFVSDVAQLLSSADVFLMPSIWEGFGLSAVEAMNAGLPVVVGDVPGLREVVDAAEPCGYLVDPLDSASIAAALRKLLVDRQQRCQLGQHAFERSKRFSVARMVDQYCEYYDGADRERADGKGGQESIVRSTPRDAPAIDS